MFTTEQPSKELIISELMAGTASIKDIKGYSAAGANDFSPALFIIMRSGVNSMNTGKAIAQACHAQAQASSKLRFRDYEPNFAIDDVEAKICLGTSNQIRLGVYIDGEDCTHDTRDWMLRCYYNLWENSADQFGVTYTWQYESNRDNDYEKFDDAMKTLLKRGQDISPFITGGIVTDPSYPISDGSVTHLVEFSTCGWLFGDVRFLKKLINDFSAGYSFHP